MLTFMLHGLVAALGDYHGLCQAVLRASAIGVDEELDEAEPAFERGRSVAQRALDRVPETEMTVHNRDHANAHQAFARGAALALPQQNAEVEDRHQNVADVLDDFAGLA